ncbi:hypothetical protein LXJ59_25935, partial [Escherichia coli]|nr:hypothetical protein [Escherichia coli]
LRHPNQVALMQHIVAEMQRPLVETCAELLQHRTVGTAHPFGLTRSMASILQITASLEEAVFAPP